MMFFNPLHQTFCKYFFMDFKPCWIDLRPLYVFLEFTYYLFRENRKCIDIFHAGLLLEFFVIKQQNQHMVFDDPLTLRSIRWLKGKHMNPLSSL